MLESLDAVLQELSLWVVDSHFGWKWPVSARATVRGGDIAPLFDRNIENCL